MVDLDGALLNEDQLTYRTNETSSTGTSLRGHGASAGALHARRTSWRRPRSTGLSRAWIGHRSPSTGQPVPCHQSCRQRTRYGTSGSWTWVAHTGQADGRHEGSSSNSNSRRLGTRHRCTGRTPNHRRRCTRIRRRNILQTTCKATRRTRTGRTRTCKRSGHRSSSTGSPRRPSTPPSHTRTHQKCRGCPQPLLLGHHGRRHRPHHARWTHIRCHRGATCPRSRTATGG